jgi:rhodanese-related sulfurtransferase
MSTIQHLSPTETHTLLAANARAVLIDVRDPVEFRFVGHPAGAINIPWKFAPEMRDNPDFVEQVKMRVPDPATPILLLCRSGQRSLAAAERLAEAGYTHLANVEEGFEGPIDAEKHRGTLGGWRFHGLPWVQS